MTGLFFGSFNPVHAGHLIIAGYMAEFADLEEVWFIVSPQNPLKPQAALAEEKHRLQMTKLAVGNHPKIKVSDVEFSLPRPSYTVNTLEQLPKNEYALIIGEDSLAKFPQWKNYEDILNNYRLYVYPRVRSEKAALRHHPSVKIIDAPVIEISSTFIRQSIRQHHDIRYMLSEPVFQYIRKHKLYL